MRYMVVGTVNTGKEWQGGSVGGGTGHQVRPELKEELTPVTCALSSTLMCVVHTS